MNRDTLIDNLVRDLSKAGYGVKSQVKERILAIIAADRQALAEKLKELAEEWAEADQAVAYGMRDAALALPEMRSNQV